MIIVASIKQNIKSLCDYGKSAKFKRGKCRKPGKVEYYIVARGKKVKVVFDEESGVVL